MPFGVAKCSLGTLNLWVERACNWYVTIGEMSKQQAKKKKKKKKISEKLLPPFHTKFPRFVTVACVLTSYQRTIQAWFKEIKIRIKLRSNPTHSWTKPTSSKTTTTVTNFRFAKVNKYGSPNPFTAIGTTESSLL